MPLAVRQGAALEPDHRRLLVLHRRLEQALAAEDWRAIAEVDKAIRSQLLALKQRPELSAEVRAANRALKELHSRALQRCVAECERLRARLDNHLENSEGRVAYQQVDLLTEGVRS